MASIDIRDEKRARLGAAAAKGEARRIVLSVLRLGVGLYVLSGWLAPSPTALTFYLTVLPLMAMYWLTSRNVPAPPAGRWPGRRPARPQAGMLRYMAVLMLWLLGFGHYLLLPA